MLPRKGDIIERLKSEDPLDFINSLIDKYEIITFIVLDKFIDKEKIIYDAFCMQTGEYFYLNSKDKDLWKKLA